MRDGPTAMRMPEPLVFARAFALGVLGAEVARASFSVGQSLASIVSNCLGVLAVIVVASSICLTYAHRREALGGLARIGRSYRFDLLAAVGIGVCTNTLISPSLATIHERKRIEDFVLIF